LGGWWPVLRLSHRLSVVLDVLNVGILGRDEMTPAVRMTIGSAVEEALSLLPEGWELDIEIKDQHADVKLYDDKGDSIVFPKDEYKFSDVIRNAVVRARELAYLGE
jgi:hypothetical protein